MKNPAPDFGSAGGVALPNNADRQGRASSPSEPLPERKKLPHEIPAWVKQGERHFITINSEQRNRDELIKNDTATRLLENALHYENIGKWYLWLLLVMPDHIHFIATFDLQQGLKSTVSAWKRYQTTNLNIHWQSDFFEHRLRNNSEFDEKCHYIRMNSVRKGLVSLPEEWPHVLDRLLLDGGSPGGLALPNGTKYKGRANSPSEPLDRNDGSAGGIALPKTSQEM